MATIRYIGTSVAVTQVDTITIGGTPATDSTFTITVTGENGDTKALTVTAGSTNVDTVAATIAAAWNASGHYLLTPITAAGVGSGGQMTLTADTAGQPFDIVSTPVAKTDGAGSPTIARAATTASKGPYDWNDVDNWDSGALPAAGDDIIREGVTILYGLNQTGGNSPDTLTIKNAQVGQNPPAGVTAAYLQIPGAPVTNIGDTFNPGTLTQAAPVMVSYGAASADIVVWGSGTNATSTLPAVWLKVNENTATLNVKGGIVGLGYQDETCAINKIRVSGGSLYCGTGVSPSGASPTVTLSGGTIDAQYSTTATIYITGGVYYARQSHASGTIYLDGGTVYTYNNLTTLNQSGGTLIASDGDLVSPVGITTINLRGGTIKYLATGTITTANIYAGTLSVADDNTARTITTLLLGRGSTFIYNDATTTLTNKIAHTSEDASGVRTISVA